MIFWFPWFLIFTFSIGSSYEEEEPEPDITPLVPYMSEQLYFELVDKEWNQTQIGSLAKSLRRQIYATGKGNNELDGTQNFMTVYQSKEVVRACRSLSNNYRNGLKTFRDHFDVRQLFTNNVEYEVGYLCYLIIYKYQMMVELYKLVNDFYYGHRWSTIVDTSLVLHMYFNLLGYEKTVLTLVDMLREIEKKYEYKEPGYFEDRGATKKPFFEEDESREPPPERTREETKVYRDKNAEKRALDRLRKKQRKQDLEVGVFQITTPSRQRKKKWPLEYGWSIEDW